MHSETTKPQGGTRVTQPQGKTWFAAFIRHQLWRMSEFESFVQKTYGHQNLKNSIKAFCFHEGKRGRKDAHQRGWGIVCSCPLKSSVLFDTTPGVILELRLYQPPGFHSNHAYGLASFLGP